LTKITVCKYIDEKTFKITFVISTTLNPAMEIKELSFYR